ncbi:MAG: hypothetical protein B6D64_06020 [Bacteroidetes bacterium 4484_276]|nr:MAG: hypothetical protein B6D64_06020 [Bacteroidetes bacterium 4484_276]
MRTMKQIMILFLIFPLVAFSQTENLKYKKVIDYVVDSIIKNDVDNYHISGSIERKTEFVDFHGISKNCEIQHQLLLEILLNGKQSKISESELSTLIPEKLKPESKNNKIEFGSIISYENIWATVIISKDLSRKEHEWIKYSLLFIDYRLIVSTVEKWHGD